MSIPSLDELLARAVEENKAQADEIDCLRDIIERTRMKAQTIGVTVADLEHILNEIDLTEPRS